MRLGINFGTLLTVLVALAAWTVISPWVMGLMGNVSGAGAGAEA